MTTATVAERGRRAVRTEVGTVSSHHSPSSEWDGINPDARLHALQSRYHFIGPGRPPADVDADDPDGADGRPTGDPTVEAVASLLEDETVRTILTETSTQPMTASELADRCGASQPTVYRRLEDLRDLDLVAERTRPDPEGGHHRQEFVPTLDHVRVDLREGTLAARVVRREAMADRFTRLVEGM